MEPSTWSTAVSELLSSQRRMSLGHGTPNESARAKLAALTPASIVGHAPADAAMANGAISALWLYHNFLDESHSLSQSIPTTTGSLLHGIMHRREGDFSNAKYWFARVGNHPVYVEILAEAQRRTSGLALTRDAEALLRGTSWDPNRFVDLVEDRPRNGSADGALETIQEAEWWTVFTYAYRAAAGT